MRLGALISLEQAIQTDFRAAAIRFSPEVTDAELTAIRQSFEDAGIWLAQAVAYCNLTSSNEQARQEAIAYMRTTLLAADKAGCMIAVTGGGHRDPNNASAVFAAHPDNWKPEALEVLADSCRQVLADLPLKQVKLAVETWVMTPLNSPQKARQLFDMVNHPNFGIVFDPVNLMNLDRCFRTGEFVNECIDVLGDAIVIAHLKDTILKPEAYTYHMSEIPIGQGNMDYPSLLQALNRLTHANIPIMIEHLSSLEQYVESGKYVRNTAASLGIPLE